jgi:hypothetical protein
LIGNQTARMVRKSKALLPLLLKSARPHLSYDSARHRPDRAVADSGGYFKDLSVSSVTAQQRAYLRAFGQLFNGEAIPLTAEDLQH